MIGLVWTSNSGKPAHSSNFATAKSCIVSIHPGSYLKEFLDELGLSQCQLGREFGVPAVRVSHVVRGKRPVTAEFALRLGRYFGKVLAIG